MNTDYNVSNVVKTNTIPSKTRTLKANENPISERMAQLANKPIGHSFTIYGVKLREVHSKIYAASRKLDVNVVTRTQGDNVMVISVDDTGQIPTGSGRSRAA